jgi:hypothetical protein
MSKGPATLIVDGRRLPRHTADGRLIHPDEEGIRNYWRWMDYGSSVLCDAEYRPRPVYHGTNQPFDNFDGERLGSSTFAFSAYKGFYFTDSAEEAGQYAELASTRLVQEVVAFEKRSAALMASMAQAEKKGDWDEVERLTLELEAHELDGIREEPAGANVIPVYLKIFNPMYIRVNGQLSTGRVGEAIDAACAKGKDALILVNIDDSPQGGLLTTHYIVFNANQIKSAIANSGAFDPDSGSLTDLVLEAPAPRKKASLAL